ALMRGEGRRHTGDERSRAAQPSSTVASTNASVSRVVRKAPAEDCCTARPCPSGHGGCPPVLPDRAGTASSVPGNSTRRRAGSPWTGVCPRHCVARALRTTGGGWELPPLRWGRDVRGTSSSGSVGGEAALEGRKPQGDLTVWLVSGRPLFPLRHR